jgi:hypothetical protein
MFGVLRWVGVGLVLNWRTFWGSGWGDMAALGMREGGCGGLDVMAFGVALIGRGWSGQFVRIANVWLGEVMSGLIWGGLIWGFGVGLLRWRCCGCGGVRALRWDSGLGRRRGGVGRVGRLLRRLRRHLRTARRSMQITSDAFCACIRERIVGKPARVTWSRDSGSIASFVGEGGGMLLEG